MQFSIDQLSLYLYVLGEADKFDEDDPTHKEYKTAAKRLKKLFKAGFEPNGANKLLALKHTMDRENNEAAAFRLATLLYLSIRYDGYDVSVQRRCGYSGQVVNAEEEPFCRNFTKAALFALSVAVEEKLDELVFEITSVNGVDDAAYYWGEYL